MMSPHPLLRKGWGTRVWSIVLGNPEFLFHRNLTHFLTMWISTNLGISTAGPGIFT